MVGKRRLQELLSRLRTATQVMRENPRGVHAELAHDQRAQQLLEAKRYATGVLLAGAWLAILRGTEVEYPIGLTFVGVVLTLAVSYVLLDKIDAAIVVGTSSAGYFVVTRVLDLSINMQLSVAILIVGAIAFAVIVTALSHRVILAAERAGFSWTDEDENPTDLIQPPA